MASSASWRASAVCAWDSIQALTVWMSYSLAFAAAQGALGCTPAAISLSSVMITSSSASEAGLAGGIVPVYVCAWPPW